MTEMQESLDWLWDTGRPLVIDDKSWRDKQEQVESLDKWFFEPPEHVQAIFEAWRSDAEIEMDDQDWDDVQDHLSQDPVAWVWFACYYKNRGHGRKKEKATPTAAQLAVLWRFAVMVDEGMPVRLALLKARQFGFSWLFSQLVLWLICNNQHINALCVAHDKKSTQAIFRYLKDGHEWLKRQIRPLVDASSKNELYLRNPDTEARDAGDVGQDSRAIVDTAGNEYAGTAEAVQVAWASEIGKWDKKSDTETIWTSFANAMQDEPNTFIFAESTAHGSGTYWHRMWESALNIGKQHWNGFTPIFIPWYFDRRNVALAPPDMVLLDREDSEYGNEKLLKETYDLDNNQLYWRRKKIDSQPEGRRKVDLFNQEHPASPAIAWLFAGGKWLEAEVMVRATARMNAEVKSGLLRPVFTGDMDPCINKAPEFCKALGGLNQNEWLRRRALGALVIYRWPNWRHDHIIGVDVSEGNDGSDASCAKVYQRVGEPKDGDALMRLCAEFYGLVTEDLLADIIWRLGWFYSTGTGRNMIPAMLAWERTGPGRGIGLWLRTKASRHSVQYPPSRMYRQQTPDTPGFSQAVNYGVSTNSATKPVMMGALKEALVNGHLQVTPEDLKDMGSVAHNDRGLLVTKGKDRTMAAAMAIYVSMFITNIWGQDDKAVDVPAEHSVAWSIRVAERSKVEPRESSEDVDLT